MSTQSNGQAVVDRHDDVWTLGTDGLMHTPETQPFPFEYVEKKWGPLRGLSNDLAPYRPRVAFTDGSIAKVITARRRYVCGNHLSQVDKHHIDPGQRCVRNSLPPHNSEVGNEHWWWLRVCLDCCPIEHDPRTPPEQRAPGVDRLTEGEQS